MKAIIIIIIIIIKLDLKVCAFKKKNYFELNWNWKI